MGGHLAVGEFLANQAPSRLEAIGVNNCTTPLLISQYGHWGVVNFLLPETHADTEADSMTTTMRCMKQQ
eukprot:5701244-Karenia_brevis.AAC.1